MEQIVARPRAVKPPAPQGLAAVLATARQSIVDGWRQREEFWLGVAFSLCVHLLLLCGLAFWRFVAEPAVEGVEFKTEIGVDAGASGPIDALPVIEAAPAGDDKGVAAAPAVLVDPSAHLGGSGGGIPSHTVAAALGGGGGPDGSGGGGGGSGLGGGVGFFGTRGEGRSFIFIVDFSGSMEGERLKRARKELVRSIEELKPYQKFFVFLYNSETFPLFELTSQADLIAATPEKRKRAIRWVRDHYAGAGTQPQEAFRRALAMQPDVIFFLTDGEIPEETRAIAQEQNKHKTVVHTIGFQSRDGEEILEGIAHDNHGRYRFVE